MHITKTVQNIALTSSVVLLSSWSFAHDAHLSDSINPATATATASTMQSLTKAEHSQQSPANSTENQQTAQIEQHHVVDHRKEHGAQIYALTTLNNRWLINDEGHAVLKSELETRIGSDENKIFIKADVTKQESYAAEYKLKTLYSRMISDFWDMQIGAQYRTEKFDLNHQQTDTEENLDGVIGLHGLAAYFFETDAYLYVGDHNYWSFSLETNRDVLLTQKMILQPYLDLDIVFSDDSKYAKKSAINHLTTGLKLRYEVSKKIMPYLDVAYEYSKGNEQSSRQKPTNSEKFWLYGAGLQLKF